MSVPGPSLCQRKPGHDAVGRALVLDLEHRPLARLVRGVEPLRDDPVEPGALEPVEPVGRLGPVAGRRGQVDRRLGRPEHRLEPGAPLSLLDRAEILVPERQEVPRHEAGRRLGGEHPDPRLGGVDPEQERVEVERPVGSRDHDLAVEDAAFRERRAERVAQLGEVAIERLQVARLGEHLVAVAEDDRPEPVPLRLVQPALAVGQASGRLRQHRLERRRDRAGASRDDSRPRGDRDGDPRASSAGVSGRQAAVPERVPGRPLVGAAWSANDHHRRIGVRGDVLGDAALEDAVEDAEAARADDDGVEPAVGVIRSMVLAGSPAGSRSSASMPLLAEELARPRRARRHGWRCHPTGRSARGRDGPGRR